MDKRLFCCPKQSISFRFGDASFDLLTDFLINLNKRNKDNLNSLSKCSGNFKDKRLMGLKMRMTQFQLGPPLQPLLRKTAQFFFYSKFLHYFTEIEMDFFSSHHWLPPQSKHAELMLPLKKGFFCFVLVFLLMPSIPLWSNLEYIFLMTKELTLDPLTGYHAIELLQRFMVKHLTDLLTTPTTHCPAADPPRSYEDTIFAKLKEKFPLIIFSCVQLASKLSLHSHIIDNSTAVRFLHSVGYNVSKKTVLETELMVLKGLEFRLNAPNPLTYVEILLEVLGHNEPSISVEHLYHLCHHVLQFVTLQRDAIFESLLVTTTQRVNPSREQREKFVTVTEDYMLLGVAVIAVASFIHYVQKWEQIVGELSHITGISRRSISDFAHVTLMHIVRTVA